MELIPDFMEMVTQLFRTLTLAVMDAEDVALQRSLATSRMPRRSQPRGNSFGTELRSVKLAEPGVNAYHLYLDEGEAFLSAVEHHLIDRWEPSDRATSFLFDLHAHLMAGDTGERVGGIIGLLGVLLSATGLILWWPARRQFSLASLLPRDLSRRTLLV